tara:strand:+ start:1529 stop:2077 length:549 start_codon:yes stop_codon:yes gene_type:complete
MANYRLTDKSALAENLAKDDLLMVVDKSDSTGSTVGTSKKVENKYIIQTDLTTINNAEFLLLATTGKEIVASPGAGYGVIPISVYCEYTQGAVVNLAQVNCRIGYVDGDANYYWDDNRYWLKGTTYSSGTFNFSGGSPSTKGTGLLTTTIDDKALYFYFTTAPTGSSTGTLKIYTTYQIIKR